MAKRRTHVDEPTEQPTADPIIRANINRQVVMSPTFASIYANDIQVQTTPWDVRLILGEIFQVPSESDQNAIIRQLGEVRMSPQLAKKVIQIVRDQLAIYEKRFGPIPQPED